MLLAVILVWLIVVIFNLFLNLAKDFIEQRRIRKGYAFYREVLTTRRAESYWFKRGKGEWQTYIDVIDCLMGSGMTDPDREKIRRSLDKHAEEKLVEWYFKEEKEKATIEIKKSKLVYNTMVANMSEKLGGGIRNKQLNLFTLNSSNLYYAERQSRMQYLINVLDISYKDSFALALEPTNWEEFPDERYLDLDQVDKLTMSGVMGSVLKNKNLI